MVQKEHRADKVCIICGWKPSPDGDYAKEVHHHMKKFHPLAPPELVAKQEADLQTLAETFSVADEDVTFEKVYTVRVSESMIVMIHELACDQNADASHKMHVGGSDPRREQARKDYDESRRVIEWSKTTHETIRKMQDDPF